MDGWHQISKAGARALLNQLHAEFTSVDLIDLEQLDTTGILTTREGVGYDPYLIPPSMRNRALSVDAVVAHRGLFTIVCAEFIRD